MFEYHGWLSTFKSLDAAEVQKALKKMNGNYPTSAQYVNGRLHISFSGNPNRDLGTVDEIVSFLCGLSVKLSGCIYINDANSERYNKFDVVKIVEDRVNKMEDKNFTSEETKKLFK